MPPETLERIPGREVVRLSFIGSIRVGSLCSDADEHITPGLTERFAVISRPMPELH